MAKSGLSIVKWGSSVALLEAGQGLVFSMPRKRVAQLASSFTREGAKRAAVDQALKPPAVNQ